MDLKAFVEALEEDKIDTGVKGMRWGVRKDRNSARSQARAAKKAAKKAPQDVVVKTKPGRRVSVKGGRRQEATEDAISASVSRRKVRVNSTDQLSTPELKKLVERMQLESNYRRLAKDDPNIAELLLSEMEKSTTK